MLEFKKIIMEIFLNYGGSVAIIQYSGTKTPEEIEMFLSEKLKEYGKIDWVQRKLSDKNPWGVMDVIDSVAMDQIIEDTLMNLQKTDSQFETTIR